ncbi:hypothetical protein B0T10DRAFT_485912 [Thelonectria olida]|uniref:ATP-dependent DNA helicase n=1 Tax=Thelonectria olida TaxID=1576542 RepID=A0A9P8W4I5_9HYPO|nr:hypothetical protein B0T10DRAFT_485912 [Thelonectria olida]
MTVGITRLAIRSSPTQRSLLRIFVQQAHVHTHSLCLDTMFAKAVKDYDSNTSARRNQLSKQLFPSSSPSAPDADIRNQLMRPGNSSVSARNQAFTNPLINRSANATQPFVNRPAPNAARGSIAKLYENSNSFKAESNVVDLTGPGPSKGQEAVFFAEDDFSDDDNLDLDFEAPTALPILGSTISAPVNLDCMPPPPKSTQSDAQIPWSSSPASHFLPPNRTISNTSTATERPLKREPPGDQTSWAAPIQKKAKRRILPASFRQGQEVEDQDDEEDCVLKTPVRRSKPAIWDPSASTLQEQKMKHRTQRLEKEPEPELDYTNDEVEEIINKSKAKTSFAISLSDEQKQVLDLVVNKNTSVFFTGAAGTGKSVLMRSIIEELHKKHAKDPERVAVTASTGLAACNIGGITLHSFSGTYPGLTTHDPVADL